MRVTQVPVLPTPTMQQVRASTGKLTLLPLARRPSLSVMHPPTTERPTCSSTVHWQDPPLVFLPLAPGPPGAPSQSTPIPHQASATFASKQLAPADCPM